MLPVAGADTLDPGNVCGFAAVGGTHDVPTGWSGGGKQAFELQGSDHVTISSQAILLIAPGIRKLVSRCQEDCPDFDLLRAFDIFVVDRLGLTDVNAGEAF
jgi:hypothetical protein